MELEDFEPPNEFEFDLSDVDVAAFESVATEDTTQNTTNNTAANVVGQEQRLSPQPKSSDTAQRIPQSSTPTPQTTQLNLQQQPKQTSQSAIQATNHNVSAFTTTSLTGTSTPAGKILLVPINSKSGTTNFKHLLQIPASAVEALTSSGSKKQVIQLAQLTSNSLNTNKNSYQLPIKTANHQLLPGSSQGNFKQHQQQHQQQTQQQLHHHNQQQQLQQIYLTTNSSPIKQALSVNSVLNKSFGNVQTPNAASTGAAAAANEVPKRKPCNCTKSQCLKLYCDCFASGEFCSGCNCTNCSNSVSKSAERSQAIAQCLERNPEAFRPKIGKAVKSTVGDPVPDSIERRHTKGCNCKRSGCLKNYCECYEAKILCSNLCKCCGCKNYEESFERKSLMQLTSSTSESARGILKNLLPTNNNSSTGKEFTKCFITDKVIRASLVCLLQSAQQAEKEGIQEKNIPTVIQAEMGKCLRMIVDSATETSGAKKR